MTTTAIIDTSAALDIADARRKARRSAPRGLSSLPYQPALDGLRAIALAGIVAYHAGIEQLRGGFLGVSSFFTLSGFLITALVVTEHAQHGRISLTGFWSRRVRRLLPAALVTIAAISVAAIFLANDSQLARLRADGLSSLFYAANWRFIFAGDSYGAAFDSPSPFSHFWSLAVEEQFYLIFPVLVTGVMWLAKGSQRVLAITFAVLAAAGTIWTATLLAGGASTDRLYFGTDTRLAELLVGGLVAIWVVRRGVWTGPTAPLTIAALVAAASMAWLWSTSSPSDAFLYRGGILVNSGFTLVIVLAAIAPRGPVRRLLSVRPLRWVGVISYGAYLIHWPAMLWLRERTGFGPWAVLAIGGAATLVLAGLSYRFIEHPIRIQKVVLVGRRMLIPATGSLVTAALLVGITIWQRPTRAPIDFEGVEVALQEIDLLADTPPPAPPATVAELGSGGPIQSASRPDVGGIKIMQPVRFAVYGDSTAMMTAFGLHGWASRHTDHSVFAGGQTAMGCGLLPLGRRESQGNIISIPQKCATWLADWEASSSEAQADVSVIQLGPWERIDQSLTPDGPFLDIVEDAELRSRLADLLRQGIDALLRHSPIVTIIQAPDVGEGLARINPEAMKVPKHDPARAKAFRDLCAEVAATFGSKVRLIDLPGWLAERDDAADLMPDGVHFDSTTSIIAGEWLVAEIVDAFRSPRV